MSLALKLVLAPVLVAQAVAHAQARAACCPRRPGRGRAASATARLRCALLIAGDSSAAGVGVAHQDQALAGHLSRALHRAHGAAGALGAARALRPDHAPGARAAARAAPPPADVAVVVTGVNDVIDLVPSRRAVQQRAALADWLLADRACAHVVFAPLPPVHRFPLLPQPLRRVMGADARRHDEALARWAATRSDVSHVDDRTASSAPTRMAEDGFHPGEPVYRVCGEALAAHIATTGPPKETHA